MASESDSPKQNPVDTISEGSTSEQKDNKIPPILHTKGQMPPANSDSDNTQQDRQYRLDRKRFWVEVVTSLAVIFYGCIAYFQLYEMRSSTDAATRAAKVAEETLKSSTASFERDQRAWVVVERFPLPPSPNVGQQFEIEMLIKNTGKTPAKNEMLVWTIDIRKSVLPRSIDYTKMKAESITIPMSAPIYTKILSEKPISKETFDGINKGDWIVYIYGRITYDDFFEHTHETKFCVYYDMSRGDIRACPMHNGAT